MAAMLIHVSGTGVVEIDLDDEAPTAGRIVAEVQEHLAETWRGNALLSRGPKHYAPTEHLRSDEDDCHAYAFALANYSRLGPKADSGPLEIPTELCGITIQQIQDLLDFVRDAVGFWSGTFGTEWGTPLCYETFNLYHARDWVIQPATANWHARGCSYVELVAETSVAQQPCWFVSHAWVEPVVHFLQCLRRHAQVRALRGNFAYWVCAYANNQHELEEEIPDNPRKTSFYRAMLLCRGVLLVLDADATPFQRIWCCFEESIAVENRDSAGLRLDVATTHGSIAHVITDGLAGEETSVLPVLGLVAKSRREEAFPTALLRSGLLIQIEHAQASQEVDKTRILNSIAFPRCDTKALDASYQESHPNYEAVNQCLASHFALNSLYGCYAQGQDPSAFLNSLRGDAQRATMQLSLAGCARFRDAELCVLLEHLPKRLLSLRLDLVFTGLEAFGSSEEGAFGCDASGFVCPNLQTLQLRFMGKLREARGLAAFCTPTLQYLELWFSNLPRLEDLQLGHSNAALLNLHLEELVLHIQGCPRVPKASKQALYNAARRLGSSNTDLEMWLCVEDVTTWSDDLKGLAVLGRGALQRLLFQAQPRAVLGTGSSSQPGLQWAKVEIDEDLPFPCSRKGCRCFHANANGYCDKHCCCGFCYDFLATISEALQRLELALIFLVQAAADIESRGLLLLILLSLCPVLLCDFGESAGMPVPWRLCAMSVLLLIGGFTYASFRFDQLQSATTELSLAVEALYAQVLSSDQHLFHVSLVFGATGDEYPSIDQVWQEQVVDLKSSFLRARRHFSCFQWAVEKAVQAAGAHGEGAQLKPADEAFQAAVAYGGAAHVLDLLYYEIHCNGLLHVQQVWVELTSCLRGEEQPVRIIALRDGFAGGEVTRVCEVVVSIDGYLATVRLLETSLASAEAKLAGLCRLADCFGLLAESRPCRGVACSQTKPETKEESVILLVALGLVRATMLLCSAYFARLYLIQYAGPSEIPTFLLHLLLCDYEDQQVIVKEPSPAKALSFAFPYAVLVIVFVNDLLRCRRPPRRKLKLSQLIYERHFGVFGDYYVLKVAILQLMTVLLQAFGKVKVLGAIVTFAMSENIVAISLLEQTFWVFWGLMALNSTYPSLLFVLPDAWWCRYGSAVMDIILDVGYVLTHLLMITIATSDLSSEKLVSGNFGEDAEMGFSNRVAPAIFLPQFFAVYGSIAHACCACRAVERVAKLPQLPQLSTRLQEQPGLLRFASTPSSSRLAKFLDSGHWLPLRRCFKVLYSPILLLILVLLLQDPDFYPSAVDFLCFPCRCVYHEDCGALSNETAGPCKQKVGNVRLESCALAATLRQEEISISGISSIAPGALTGLGCHVKRLSFSNSNLTSLPARRFESLGCLLALDLGKSQLHKLDEEAFVGLTQLRLLSLSQNKLTNLSANLSHMPRLEQLLLGGKRNKFNKTVVRGNNLVYLPLLAHPRLQVVDISENLLTAMPMAAFTGFPSLRILDLGRNKLASLPEGLLEGLASLQTLDLSSNELASLPEGLFAGVASLQRLDLSLNRLSALPQGQFAGLASLQTLDLSWNYLAALPEELFAGLASLQSLDLRSNKVASLPDRLFAGLASLQTLGLSSNQLASLPEGLFADLAWLQNLDLRWNNLASLPEGLFADLASLWTLDLSSNILQTLPEELFAGVASLQRLDLRSNKLASLPDRLFAGLASLQRLDLRSNKVASLPDRLFAGLASLQTLGLSSNRLASLPEGLFADLAWLQNLDLRWNKLASLPEGLFAGLTRLRTLDLSSNRLRVLPEALCADLAQLRELTAMPQGLFTNLTLLHQPLIHGNGLPT
ncbi:Igfals [Symbiodinium sp. CCMP2592]|nr:Igfals [Symbiodinium sp. CCMP2592]